MSNLTLVRDLAPLEAFDKRAFEGDATYSRQLCEVVLALAVAFNDSRDLILGHQALAAYRPPDDVMDARTGDYRGLQLHLVRLHLGLVHELLELMAENAGALEEPAFTKIVRNMHAGSRVAWETVTAAVKDKGPASGRLGRFLFFARNKIVYHYDRKLIGQGYAIAFADDKREPYVSRGATVLGSRFYFADAAVESYMRSLGDPQNDATFADELLQLIEQLTLAIHDIVEAFIVARGFGWRLPVTPN